MKNNWTKLKRNTKNKGRIFNKNWKKLKKSINESERKLSKIEIWRNKSTPKIKS